MAEKIEPPRDRTLLAVYEASKPVIAAVNGPAMGAGINLALAADVRIASRNAIFSQSHVRRCAVIDFVGSARTRGIAPESVARGGSVIVVGLFGGALSVSTALFPMRNVTLRGSCVGSLEEMKALLALLEKRRIESPVQLQLRPMSQRNAALDDLARGRRVLVNDGPEGYVHAL